MRALIYLGKLSKKQNGRLFRELKYRWNSPASIENG
jgi:hypothetical protein